VIACRFTQLVALSDVAARVDDVSSLGQTARLRASRSDFDREYVYSSLWWGWSNLWRPSGGGPVVPVHTQKIGIKYKKPPTRRTPGLSKIGAIYRLHFGQSNSFESAALQRQRRRLPAPISSFHVGLILQPTHDKILRRMRSFGQASNPDISLKCSSPTCGFRFLRCTKPSPATALIHPNFGVK
jgi:hypothetical protein